MNPSTKLVGMLYRFSAAPKKKKVEFVCTKEAYRNPSETNNNNAYKERVRCAVCMGSKTIHSSGNSWCSHDSTIRRRITRVVFVIILLSPPPPPKQTEHHSRLLYAPSVVQCSAYATRERHVTENNRHSQGNDKNPSASGRTHTHHPSI